MRGFYDLLALRKFKPPCDCLAPTVMLVVMLWLTWINKPTLLKFTQCHCIILWYASYRSLYCYFCSLEFSVPHSYRESQYFFGSVSHSAKFLSSYWSLDREVDRSSLHQRSANKQWGWIKQDKILSKTRPVSLCSMPVVLLLVFGSFVHQWRPLASAIYAITCCILLRWLVFQS